MMALSDSMVYRESLIDVKRFHEHWKITKKEQNMLKKSCCWSLAARAVNMGNVGKLLGETYVPATQGVADRHSKNSSIGRPQ
jgi:hypothetical protein